jgi:molybdopterin converting factor small subunit
LFFATLRDRAGARSTDLDIPPGVDVGGLKSLLGATYPDLLPSLPTALVSINREYAFDDAPIPENAEVALFPPVSGG